MDPASPNLERLVIALTDVRSARDALRLEGAKVLGRGTGRTVVGFSEDASIVLKVARNPLGIAQNEVEFRTCDVDFTARVIAHASDYAWILSERCARMDKAIFKGLGIRSEGAFYYGVCALAHGPTGRISPEDVLPDQFARIRPYLARWPQLMPYDIGAFSSWGLRGTVPVLVDHGFTFMMNWHRDRINNGEAIELFGEPSGVRHT